MQKSGGLRQSLEAPESGSSTRTGESAGIVWVTTYLIIYRWQLPLLLMSPAHPRLMQVRRGKEILVVSFISVNPMTRSVACSCPARLQISPVFYVGPVKRVFHRKSSANPDGAWNGRLAKIARPSRSLPDQVCQIRPMVCRICQFRLLVRPSGSKVRLPASYMPHRKFRRDFELTMDQLTMDF